MRDPAQGALAEPAQGEPLGVGVARGGVGIGGMEKFAFLGAEQEQAAVNQPEELLEKGVLGERAVLKPGPEGGIGGMGNEAGAKLDEGLGNALAQTVPDTESLRMAFSLPFFPDAFGGRRLGRTGARDMKDAPERGEIGVALLFVAEDGFEVELEEVGAGQGVGVPEEAEGFAIGHEGPEGVRGGVEIFLSELMGGFFPGAGTGDGELGNGLIQSGVVRGNDDGKPTPEGLGGDGESAVSHGDGLGQEGEVGEPEALLEQLEHEAAGN